LSGNFSELRFFFLIGLSPEVYEAKLKTFKVVCQKKIIANILNILIFQGDFLKSLPSYFYPLKSFSLEKCQSKKDRKV
jgi:hypothetical protein